MTDCLEPPRQQSGPEGHPTAGTPITHPSDAAIYRQAIACSGSTAKLTQLELGAGKDTTSHTPLPDTTYKSPEKVNGKPAFEYNSVNGTSTIGLETAKGSTVITHDPETGDTAIRTTTSEPKEYTTTSLDGDGKLKRQTSIRDDGTETDTMLGKDGLYHTSEYRMVNGQMTRDSEVASKQPPSNITAMINATLASAEQASIQHGGQGQEALRSIKNAYSEQPK